MDETPEQEAERIAREAAEAAAAVVAAEEAILFANQIAEKEAERAAQALEDAQQLVERQGLEDMRLQCDDDCRIAEQEAQAEARSQQNELIAQAAARLAMQ